MPEQEYVRFLDTKSNTVSLIDPKELGSGVVLVDVEGHGECYAEAAEFSPSPVQHPPFPEDVRFYIRAIQEGLSEVFPQSFDEWEEGFRRDASPNREIAIWYHLAEVYVDLVAEHNYDPPHKSDAFKILYALTMVPPAQIRTLVDIKVMTDKEAQQVIERNFRPRAVSE